MMGLRKNNNTTTGTQSHRRRKKRSQFHGRSTQFYPQAIAALFCVIVVLIILLFWVLPDQLFLLVGITRGHVRLPVANVDVPVPSASEWPLIHIVHTRFMQEQGHLATLGMARLRLFETFCLPTMVGQSTQDYLWIIKTDPKLDSTVLDRLLSLVRPYSNIYVIASNHNFLISPDLVGSWRDGAEGMDILKSNILYAGNRTKLDQAMALREDRPILETRLDADDGLHQNYLKYIQWVAKRRFFGSGREKDSETDEGHKDDDGHEEVDGEVSRGLKEVIPKWLYWCSRRHIEWRSGPMTNESISQVDKESLPFPFGILNPVEHSKLCITPGITVGYNVGTVSTDVPIEAHDVLYKHLMNPTSCYDDESIPKVVQLTQTKTSKKKEQKPLCLELVDDLKFTAIRSRTWTSAGMQDVASPDRSYSTSVQDEMTRTLWKFLKGSFHMKEEDTLATQEFLYMNQAQIAYENLLGQCTSFHSCKQQAKDALEAYIKQAAEKGIHVIQQHPPAAGIGRLRLSS